MRNRFFVYALCLAVLNLATPQVAQAAFIGTLQAVEAAGTRAHDLEVVSSTLAREQVRGQMEATARHAIPQVRKPRTRPR